MWDAIQPGLNRVDLKERTVLYVYLTIVRISMMRPITDDQWRYYKFRQVAAGVWGTIISS